METHKLLETIADIAYIAGVEKYYSGDSRNDMANFIWWAQEFEIIHSQTDWSLNNYMLAIDLFAMSKLSSR